MIVAFPTTPNEWKPLGRSAFRGALAILNGLELVAGNSSSIFGITVGEMLDKSEVCLVMRQALEKGNASGLDSFLEVVSQQRGCFAVVCVSADTSERTSFALALISCRPVTSGHR